MVHFLLSIARGIYIWTGMYVLKFYISFVKEFVPILLGEKAKFKAA